MKHLTIAGGLFGILIIVGLTQLEADLTLLDVARQAAGCAAAGLGLVQLLLLAVAKRPRDEMLIWIILILAGVAVAYATFGALALGAVAVAMIFRPAPAKQEPAEDAEP
ncbi:MAG: hypothetical protein ACYS8X_11400 [Planctomycetota bacterium]|jgi:hypothetical protein